MDIRRAVLWIIFSASSLLLYDAYLKSVGRASLLGPPAIVAPNKGSAIVSSTPGPADNAVPAASTAGAPAAAVTAAASAPASAEPSAQRPTPVRVKTDVITADIDLLGAQLSRLELLRQRDQADPKQNVVLLDDRPGTRVYLAQTGLINGPFPNHRTLFTWVPGPTELAPNQDTLTVNFEAQAGDVKLRKSLTFKRGAYDIGVHHEVTNLGAAPVNPALYLQLERDGQAPAGEAKFMVTYTGPAIYTDADKYKKISFSDIEKNKAETNKSDPYKKADNGWIAIIQHYFVTAWVPKQGVEREIRTRKVSDDRYAVSTVQPLGTIAPGATVSTDSLLFAGPQDQKVLEQLAPGLDLVVDYGWLTIIAKPLFWLLQLFHSWTGNWGWAIILLTILVKGAFYPLSAASYKSMAKMKAVTPRLTRIREQYKDDRMKMNTAMMELYKTEKINPLGGCLPVVVQIPVFIALYWTLLAAVEMRGAPWIGWIHDLTAADPFFILPVLMIATMFVQFKLNPTPPDPIQAKVFMFMPLIFGGMMIFFPAGLVLYWVVNNMLSIAQQWQISRMIEGKPVFGRAKK